MRGEPLLRWFRSFFFSCHTQKPVCRSLGVPCCFWKRRLVVFLHSRQNDRERAEICGEMSRLCELTMHVTHLRGCSAHPSHATARVREVAGRRPPGFYQINSASQMAAGEQHARHQQRARLSLPTSRNIVRTTTVQAVGASHPPAKRAPAPEDHFSVEFIRRTPAVILSCARPLVPCLPAVINVPWTLSCCYITV